MKEIKTVQEDLNNAGKEKLLEEIESKAREEAEEILDQARSSAEQKRKAALGKAERLKKEAEERVADKIAQLEKHNEASIAVKRKQAQLKRNEDIIREVFRRVEDEIKRRVQTEEYQKVLLDWTVEAAVGIDADEVLLAVSPEEKSLVTEDFLRRAAERAGRIRGKETRLAVEGREEGDYGVRAFTKDGRLEYRNQIKNRIQRNQARYRRVIFSNLRIEEME